jgi:hypothetical protein
LYDKGLLPEFEKYSLITLMLASAIWFREKRSLWQNKKRTGRTNQNLNGSLQKIKVEAKIMS